MSYDPELDFDRSSLDDDQLRMLFTCCHPALAADARMALTLRSVAGLTVPEIARAFLTDASARWSSGSCAPGARSPPRRIPFRVPPDDMLAERLAGVLRVVYLVFTEGHMATCGESAVRGDLCEEAIRLARLIARLMPDEAEALGLLALLLLTDARRAARLDGGELVALEDQDRTRWDAARITEGVAVLERGLALGRPGPYLIQAAIAGLHAQATTLGGDRLAADRRPLRRARAPRRLAGRDRQPRRRGRPRARPRGRAGDPGARRRRSPARALPAAARGARRAAPPRGRPRSRCGVRPRDRAVGHRRRALRTGAPAAFAPF